MPLKVRPKAVIRRWFHHRTRSEYRELESDTENDLPDKVHDWRTVPGLVLDDQQTYLSVDDNVNSLASSSSGNNEACRDDTITNSCLGEERIDDMHYVMRGLSKSQSCGTIETEEESDPAGSERNLVEHRSVRWADAEGKSLVTRYEIEMQAPLNVRVVILMLNPSEKIFEFVQCEFKADERLTVSDLLVQIPFMASMEALRKQRYSGLYRGDREMVNIISVQDYEIAEGEILVAIASGTNPKHSIAAAAALLLQRSLLRAVQKAKLSGRALQKLLSSAELDAVLEAALPEPVRKCEEDDESRDDCRLVLRVLDKEFGSQFEENTERNALKKRSPLHDDDDDEDDECNGPGEDGGFPFVTVPDLEDQEFSLFQKEARIDPFSLVARGRMAEIPSQLLSDEAHLFEPPFGSTEDSTCWDEVLSDEEMDDLEPEPVDSFTPVEEDVDTGFPCLKESILDEYVGGLTAFSDVSDSDDEEADDNQGHFISFSCESSLKIIPSRENVAEDIINDPIPEIIIETDEHEEDNVLSSPSLPDREGCESLSHISEVGSLEECDDTSVPIISPQASEDSTEMLLPQVSKASTDSLSDLPEIVSTEEREGPDSYGNGFSSISQPSPETLVQEGMAFVMAVALLIGAVTKISIKSSHQPKPPQLEIDEAEV